MHPKPDEKSSEAGSGESLSYARGVPATEGETPPVKPFRAVIGGVLMGIANLIPGVSGGTMILAMGLYEEFIDGVADVTALRFRARRIIFLGIVGSSALVAIFVLAGVILDLLFHYPIAMYALFIGLTLGGAPILGRMLKPWRADAIVAAALGFLAMVGVAMLRSEDGLPQNHVMDFVSGVVGSTTMVLPGISGSQMLLVMGQYEHVIRAVENRDLLVIGIVGVGAVMGIVGLSNLLKWLLHRFHRATVGVLLGILLGAVIVMWPFDQPLSDDALERRTMEELVTFAEAWQVPGVAAIAERDEMVERLVERWPDRAVSAYTPQNMATAAGMVVLGFGATMLLARREPTAGG